MFFANVKNQAEQGMNAKEKEYQKCYQEVLTHNEALLNARYESVQLLHSCEEYIQQLSDKPYEYDLKSKNINRSYQEFEKQLKKYKYKVPKSKAGLMFGTSAAAGAGVAVFAPNAALAAATAFGTASTGTAISALGGAAATNAALAWLGGGALAAGGAGIAGGQALLALAGPVGLAIGLGGAAAAGFKVFADNKKKAQNAELEAANIAKEITRLKGVQKRIDVLKDETVSLNRMVEKELANLKNMKAYDYKKFSGGQVRQLQTMMNNAQSLTAKVTERIPMGR